MDIANRMAFLDPDPADLDVVRAVQGGLPLTARPYARIAERIGMSEGDVIERMRRLVETGDIRRLGIVVRHRELGYGANAMVVWDVPDEQITEIGRTIGSQPFVNLCYRRPRRPPIWHYNLFCMIHGRSREGVLANLRDMIERCGLKAIEYDVLFSRRRFKQRGARYGELAVGNAGQCRAPAPRVVAD